MRVLITSGGTTERIDDVRGISNFATGSLGKITAEQFLQAGHEVFLLASETAILPEAAENLTIIHITTTDSLVKNMEKLVPEVDAVVHTMAVSDYQPVFMTALSNFSDDFSKDDLLHFSAEKVRKISSNSDFQLMLLKKTPKVISYIKKWNPQVQLFGFKLLAGVSEQELVDVAQKSLVKNQADFIIANDLENITKTQHEALLISFDRIVKMHTKLEIAQSILEKAQEAYHG
ncbi:phosphopantothenate--cysteine ligase [Lactococcus nasutitermitis]|uniref:Phosphopantothenate--cysteine ligase n=1 Tax=Lactococcus nasutitermitis TaxID=1652957 RepID=A0ABV9JET5_9LACT|nr:phosphopantothenate--cysteine ligase [Lactococcus nasutitermitis]